MKQFSSIIQVMDTKELGFFAENIAAQYLMGKGYDIVERNYRKPWGEIDLVTRKDNVFIFVEVKANKKEFSGGFDPEVRVDWRKMHKIQRTAALYLEREQGGMDCEWQIDIVTVTLDEANKKAKIKHFKRVSE